MVEFYSGVDSKSFETKHTAEIEPETHPSEVFETPNVDLDSIQWSSHGDKRRKLASTEVELSTVMAACPEFATMARGLNDGYIRNWDDLHRVVGQIRPMAGISEDAWNVAQQKLGPMVAAAAIALIYDKYAREEIAKPGGYLRGMVAKALEGELHLERSFYGRLSGAGG